MASPSLCGPLEALLGAVPGQMLKVEFIRFLNVQILACDRCRKLARTSAYGQSAVEGITGPKIDDGEIKSHVKSMFST